MKEEFTEEELRGLGDDAASFTSPERMSNQEYALQDYFNTIVVAELMVNKDTGPEGKDFWNQLREMWKSHGYFIASPESYFVGNRAKYGGELPKGEKIDAVSRIVARINEVVRDCLRKIDAGKEEPDEASVKREILRLTEEARKIIYGSAKSEDFVVN